MKGNLDLEFRKHLCEHDSVFLKVIEKHPPLELSSARPPFEALARIVTGQQLSVQAAATVFQRLELAIKIVSARSDFRPLRVSLNSGAVHAPFFSRSFHAFLAADL